MVILWSPLVPPDTYTVSLPVSSMLFILYMFVYVCVCVTQVQSLGWQDLLEREMATHSSILAWKIPWMEEPGRLQPMGSQRVRHD